MSVSFPQEAQILVYAAKANTSVFDHIRLNVNRSHASSLCLFFPPLSSPSAVAPLLPDFSHRSTVVSFRLYLLRYSRILCTDVWTLPSHTCVGDVSLVCVYMLCILSVCVLDRKRRSTRKATLFALTCWSLLVWIHLLQLSGWFYLPAGCWEITSDKLRGLNRLGKLAEPASHPPPPLSHYLLNTTLHGRGMWSSKIPALALIKLWAAIDVMTALMFKNKPSQAQMCTNAIPNQLFAV